jgi:hypothetical protein
VSCPSSNRADGKHPRGYAGCGCPDDPDLKRKRTTEAQRGGRSRTGRVKGGHEHDYTVKNTGTEKRGGKTYSVVYEECLSKDGCPQPTRKIEVEVSTDSGARCSCCGSPFPRAHSHRNCATCDEEWE